MTKSGIMTKSLRNRVQLLGYVSRKPKKFKYRGQPYVRLLIEVDEVDDKGQQFFSYHPVIIPEEVNNNEHDGPVCRGDLIMVEGRLNNYMSEDTNNHGTNIQASCLLVLRRAADIAKELMHDEVSNDVKDRLDRAKEAVASGNVVSLRIVEQGDDEPPF